MLVHREREKGREICILHETCPPSFEVSCSRGHPVSFERAQPGMPSPAQLVSHVFCYFESLGSVLDLGQLFRPTPNPLPPPDPPLTHPGSKNGLEMDHNWITGAEQGEILTKLHQTLGQTGVNSGPTWAIG